MPIRTRRQLATVLEGVMGHAYAQLQERQRLDADSSLLKSYLIEAHLPDPNHDAVVVLLRNSFGQQVLGDGTDAEVIETDEELFFNVEVRWRRFQATFYVDATDGRFWVLHSTSKSTSADPILRRLTTNDDRFDSAWLPAQFLEQVGRMGVLRGLGLDYDRREVPDIDFEAAEASVEFLKMQLWGNRATDVLRVLRQEDAFPESTTLSKVKVKHWVDRQADENLFSIGDVKYDGKITARGTSFQSHISLLTTLYRLYGDKIRQFERSYGLKCETEDGRCALKGEPLNIVFSRPIPNIVVFVDSLFSGAHPFKLWGVPTQIRPDYYRVAGIDLHVSQRVNFEITPSYLRLYLPSGSCGNTLSRLYTNLQHYYDSRVRIRTGSGEYPFEF